AAFIVTNEPAGVFSTPSNPGLPVSVWSGDVPIIRDHARARDGMCSADLAVVPDRHRAVVAAPENVVVAVAVEVARARDMRRTRNHARLPYPTRPASLPAALNRTGDPAVVFPAPSNPGLPVAVCSGDVPIIRDHARAGDSMCSADLAVVP